MAKGFVCRTRIKHGGRVHEPGEIIKDLTDAGQEYHLARGNIEKAGRKKRDAGGDDNGDPAGAIKSGETATMGGTGGTDGDNGGKGA
jgi:hypothetical protein